MVLLINPRSRVLNSRLSRLLSTPPKTVPDESSLQKNFLSLNIEDLIKEYADKNPSELEREGFEQALHLFHQAAERVPAYKDFLKKNNIDHSKIITYQDFQGVPIINKKNYLRAYPLKELCWDGEFKDLYILSSSSGSTGEPFLWPRGEEQELEGGLNFELIFKEFFNADKLKTLYIVCFAMGTWISGPFVLACAEYINRKGYPILSVTPGLDKEVMFALFNKLAPNFDQIVISGYPPYVKDILDLGKDYGVNWKKHQVKFLFAAEGFSEKWRDYIHDKVGSKDVLTTSINIYGSADAAIVAHETPVTTAVRRMVSDSPELVESLFLDNRLPTLAQYDPRLKYIEEVDRSVIFTTRAGLPLIRYSIGDTGGVFGFSQMREKLGQLGFNLDSLFGKQNKKRFYWKLPFVYVFGRTDFTVSLYGLLIYPEHIKFGLEIPSLSKEITGKFVMSIEYNDKNDPYLLARVELTKGIKASERLSKKIQNCIVKGLVKVNSEYSKLLQSVGDKAIPLVELIENSNIDYFRPGAKQRWVKKA